MKAYGVLGGTFDPVHIGHLRLAMEAAELAELEHVRLIPCHIPVHRDPTVAGSLHRLHMLQKAASKHSGMVVDDRELRRPGPSYMFDTLQSLCADFPQQAACLILGADAFAAIDTWHRWRELLQCCHFVVASRPGSATVFKPDVQSLVDAHRCRQAGELKTQKAGRIYFIEIVPLAISASRIRQLRSQGRDIRYLVDDAVFDYISQHRLYSTL